MRTADRVVGYFLIVVAFSLAAHGLPTPAGAMSFTLDNWNVNELNDSGDFVQVDVGTNSDGNTTLTLRWHPGSNNVLTAIGIDKFGYHTEGGLVAVLNVSDPTGGDASETNDGWSKLNKVNGRGVHNYDGAGAFNSGLNQHSGGTGGVTGDIVFVLEGSPVFAPNENNPENLFAAHVRYENGCSGYVTDGGIRSSSIGSDSNCAAVPEPTVLLFIGSGFVGLGLWQWRRHSQLKA